MGTDPADAPLRVVAVTFSPGESLGSFLCSLETATTRPVDVVLADNGSTDGAPEEAARRDPAVRVLPTGGNVGYGAAANAGLADVHSGWALVANPDVRFEPGDHTTSGLATTSHSPAEPEAPRFAARP